MILIDTKLDGVYIIENIVFKDQRGVFCKTFNSEAFSEKKLCSAFKESYYSISQKNVIRGMHFQLPPHDHHKLVYVPHGEVMDVILDLRNNSDTFGEYITVNLSKKNKSSVYIPKGLAHGFKSLQDNTIAVYNVSTVYNENSDSGIHWNSFGLDWEIDEPIISKKDRKLIKLKDFDTPF